MSLPFVPIWEEYRQGERDFHKFYLAGADLQAAVMPEIILEEADLREANLKGADLSGGNLRAADLSRVNLREARLLGTDLTGANLVGANLTGADLTGAILNKAHLRLSTFTRANLTNASLVDVDGRGWVESDEQKNTHIRRTSFQEAILRDADLTDAYLRLCIFRGADLTNAKLASADLTGADATPLTVEQQKPRYAIFQGADMRQVCLRNARLTYCDFRSANLRGADLRQAALGGSFKEADLSQALFFDTELEKCDFTGAILAGTNLDGCKFNHVRMPDGNPPGRSYDKFVGPPPNPTGSGVSLRPVVYTEFWFETYEEIKALSWPALCVCCTKEFDRYERFSREQIEAGILKVYEVRVPYCTVCLQHNVRTRNVKNWLKPSCAAQGESSPAVKFEVKSRGMLSAKEFYVLYFANPEYIIGFASGNGLPVKGFKGSW